MRTLTPALLAELGATITRPGYLVQIDFSTVLRLSTLGDVSFESHTWSGTDIKVRGLSQDERAGQSGSLVLANTWGDYGAIVLGEGVADRAVSVWACYAGAPADSVAIFSGVGDEASIDDAGAITITLATSALRTAFWPRRRINAANGFNHLIPAGRRFVIGGQPYLLER